MAFSDRMKEVFDQSVAASKELAAKAGATAQKLGEQGVLMVEIRQLEAQAQKLVGRLGAEAYQAFAERQEDTISAGSAPIRTILSELALVRESIERKEAELKLKKGN
ncbi:hypothetical protein [Leadbettera azotonutricia]|uniref:Uncharacterized protein n=1 Tax=Leadbettera azotonutricia (strain ATCC BAA-888 / DSM 13862 / ZAS-9) TaxID=545695 RepID=F5Y9J5_LEAAZ|nr:hypothetical protein [Leadbettera azotonutricia]AEF80131.1 hypothetical protein TREAZ_0844 [Leadbettera azotonutricia ZAS-9]